MSTTQDAGQVYALLSDGTTVEIRPATRDDFEAVKDVMTTQVFWVERDTPFAAIAAALRQHRVSAFPVLNEAGQVIGVVSLDDTVEHAARLMYLRGVKRLPVEQGHDIVFRIRHVQGVVAVRDRLSYPDMDPVVAGPVW